MSSKVTRRRASISASTQRTPPPAAIPVVYKHRQVIEFKGVSYRYNKSYGEFHLVDPKRADYFVPDTIHEWRGGAEWEVCSTRAATPIAALETWFAELVKLTREGGCGGQTEGGRGRRGGQAHEGLFMAAVPAAHERQDGHPGAQGRR